MLKKWVLPLAASAAVLLLGTWAVPSRAQDVASSESDPTAAAMPVSDSECTFFGAQRDHFLPRTSRTSDSRAGSLTRQFQAASPEKLTVTNWRWDD